MWVLDYLDDIESDLSVFHHVDDMYSMDSAKFFRFAMRLGAYDGALANRLQRAQEEEKDTANSSVIAAKMKASQARYEGGNGSNATVSKSSLIDQMVNDPDFAAKIRAQATINK